MPETVDSERMVTLWITEYMLNTAGYAYQTAGFLQYNLTSDDVSLIKFGSDSVLHNHVAVILYRYFFLTARPRECYQDFGLIFHLLTSIDTHLYNIVLDFSNILKTPF